MARKRAKDGKVPEVRTRLDGGPSPARLLQDLRFRMIMFAESFPDGEIVSTLSRQLSWSHVIEILQLKDPLQRDFYAEMCRIERWGVGTLRAKIGGMLFERTALSRKPEEVIKQELAKLREGDTLTPDLVFRDPYFLDFLGLVELLQLDKSGIRVASYLAELPPRRLLQKKLHETMIAARARLEAQQSGEAGAEDGSQ